MPIDKRQLDVRRPMVAGMFYPSNPIDLSREVAAMYATARKRALSGPVKAVIVPHAGYMYSGQVAAEAFKQLEGQQYDTVVVVAPFHGFFKGVSVYSGGGYQTPLGVIEIDRKLSDAIADKVPDVYSSTVGHTGSGGRGEHSLEVQLPFLQIVLGKSFKLVAIVMGEQEESTIRAAAEAITSAVTGSNTLLVASSDLSHFYTQKEANRLDKVFEEAVAAYDPDRLIREIESGKTEACGFGPVATVLQASKRLGGQGVEIIAYNTSGAVTGDFSEVVGYLSAAVIGSKAMTKQPATIGKPRSTTRDPEHTEEEKDYLKSVAREAVEARAHSNEYQLPPAPTQRLGEKRAVFVTITRRGQLRGCIGLVQARKPLAEAVAEMAQEAAFEDPRFESVAVDELEDLDFEISILSPLKTVEDPDTIVVGRDGLMIKLDFHSGLLLPQVASEHHWDRTTFLEQTCLKAGLPKNSYRDRNAQIYSFTVEKF
jgi:AmmeMemoRadiSam system protein B/AmmeMemoRadiSam system protein A